MQLFKKIGLGVFLVLLMMSAISFFIPSGVFLERSFYIKEPTDTLYNHINDLQKWSHWSPWHIDRPATEVSYVGSGVGVGSAMEWKNSNPTYDDGRVEIKKVDPGKEVNTILYLEDNGYAFSDFYISENDTTSLVRWTYTQNIPWYDFFGKYKGLIKENLVGDKMYLGLAELNAYMTGRSKD